MNRNCSLLVLTFSLMVAVLVFSGCGNNGDEAQEGSAGSTASTPAVSAGPGAREGVQVPDFNLKRIEGGTMQLSELRGKTVLLDFWDTWCPPCRAAMPHLEEISVKYKDNLVVVGIAFGRQGEAAVAKFIKDQNLTFDFVLADQKVIMDFGGLQSIPTTFLVDSDGMVVKKWVGGQSKEAYEEAIKALIES